MAFVELISVSRCRTNVGTFVECGASGLAVFRLVDPDRVVVIDNACPHAGGNLSGGDLCGNIVTCNWHQWKFDLDTGLCTESDKARVRRYPVEVRDGMIWVDLADNER